MGLQFSGIWRGGLRVYAALQEFYGTEGGRNLFFSGGAADSGIGRLSFSEEEYTIDELYYSHSEYDFERGLLAVQCYLKGALCTKERYEDGMRRQEEKADAVWYDLTADNINSALSDY